MQTRSLGRHDLRLSEITLGTWGLAEQSYGIVTPERFDQTVKSAIEQGVTSFDLAPLWGDGEGERRVGRLLAETKVEAVVITRAGARRVDGKLSHGFSPDELVADCEGSLERLGREQIDLWLLHNPGDDVLRREEWRPAVERLEEEGKIRAWGASVSDADEARLAITAGAQAICLPHNLLMPTDLDDLRADIEQAGCGVLARSPLAYGLLAGQWAEDRFFAEDDHRARRWNDIAFSERLRQVNALRFLVGQEHRDLATAALRFVLTHRTVTTAIVGARATYQIAAAVEAASGPPYLSDATLTRLAKVRDQAGI
jgi:aryl-alcohol dehydrogenase-like predicted oxidoreductase